MQRRGQPIPRVFTLEVGGEPTLSFEALRQSEARQMTQERWLLADLRKLRSRGVALWDGKAKLTVRAGTEVEAAVFRKSQAATELADDEDLVLAFLKELD